MGSKREAAIDVTDPTLFGNDAAEDEDADVFESYFLDRPEINEFLHSSRKLKILRAYRGEGKSAILRKAHQKLSNDDGLAVKTVGSSLAPDWIGIDSDKLVRAWERNILGLIASEVGSRIGLAWTDDAMCLVEEAEKNGFKSRSFISSIWERLKLKDIPQRERPEVGNPERLVARWLQGKQKIWLFVDDIDENFQNTPEFRAKVGSFFTACRHIVNLVPEIRIRTGIRPNVWRIVRREAESLSKVEQYCVTLGWNMELLRAVTAKRIEGYLVRNEMSDILAHFEGQSREVREERLIAVAFQDPMEWGYNQEKHRPILRSPHVVLSNLSQGRPRWLIELAKLAAPNAKVRHSVIEKDDITSVLKGFGRARIDDLSAEYTSECPQVKEIINAFTDGSEDYSTAELHTTITNRVLQHLNVSLAGLGRAEQPTQVAAFLYMIGFLTAREELPDGEYRHSTFAEEPDLLQTRTNLDRGMAWEIHPVFRQALGLRTPSGRKIIKKKPTR